jgi:Holliday junction resolvase-like predicted endonuclease
VLARNVRVGRSEIDLVIRDGDATVLVEVKTRSVGDPVTRFDESKIDALRRASARMRPRPHRIDLVTVEMGEGAATIVWRRGVA